MGCRRIAASTILALWWKTRTGRASALWLLEARRWPLWILAEQLITRSNSRAPRASLWISAIGLARRPSRSLPAASLANVTDPNPASRQPVSEIIMTLTRSDFIASRDQLDEF